jgi:hypothetical protein
MLDAKSGGLDPSNLFPMVLISAVTLSIVAAFPLYLNIPFLKMTEGTFSVVH